MKNLNRICAGLVHRWKQRTFRPYVIERQFGGEHLRFCIGDLFGEKAYGPQHSVWPELEWIKLNAIRPGDVVVDCGANHGFSTVLFAIWTGPQGKVIAFEPFSHNMGILAKNVELNSIPNVICHRAAVGAQKGSACISAHPNAHVISNGKWRGVTEEVSMVTLDDSVERADFLKVDVEGFELEVLKGAERILGSKPRLDVELHVAFYEDKPRQIHDVFNLIGMDRYRVHVQLEVDGPIVPFERDRHSIEALSRQEVVHLFCI